MRTKIILNQLLLLAMLSVPLLSHAQRDPFVWPFDKESIWNMPIHNNAQYYDIPNADFPGHGRYGVDENWIIRCKSSDPVRTVYQNTAPLSSGAPTCTGTNVLYTMNIPNGEPINCNSNRNDNFAFLLPNGNDVRTGNVLRRGSSTGPLYHRSWYKTGSISGDGITNQNGQGASRMSAMGGTIRKEDIQQGEIRHAIKFTIWADEHFYFNSGQPCYRWPAQSCDSYAPDAGKYRGSNPNLIMGILFAIKPNVSIAAQNFETSFAPVLVEALQKYGGYAVF